MPPKAVESQVMRMPKQFVRAGRGVAGYTGKVEVYETTSTIKGAAADAKRAEAAKSEKLEAGKLTRKQLEEIALSEGFQEDQLVEYGSKAELVAAIEAKRAEAAEE